MAKRRKSKKRGIPFIAAIIILVIIIAALAVLYMFKPQLFDSFFSLFYDEVDEADNPYNQTLAEGARSDIVNADLSIHFLELGNKYTGDCTLIKCGDTEVLIDAGSEVSSASTLNDYISQYCTDGMLEYVVATHAHEDHIAGFVGEKNGDSYNGILYTYNVGTIIEFAKTNSSSNIYKNYCTARDYAVSCGAVCYTALQCYNNDSSAQRQYFLDDNKSISINILYNYYYENKSSNENDYSVCIILTQQTESETLNYLFTGDLEEKGESYLVDNNELPHVELFKGGHHGSSTSTTDKLLAAITPENIAICTCVGSSQYSETNANQFPTQEVLDRICKYTENIYCTTLMNDYSTGDFTSMNGNIVFYYGTADGENSASLKLWCSNNNTKLKDTDWFASNRTWNA